jgi:hypothetical protein
VYGVFPALEESGVSWFVGEVVVRLRGWFEGLVWRSRSSFCVVSMLLPSERGLVGFFRGREVNCRIERWCHMHVIVSIHRQRFSPGLQQCCSVEGIASPWHAYTLSSCSARCWPFRCANHVLILGLLWYFNARSFECPTYESLRTWTLQTLWIQLLIQTIPIVIFSTSYMNVIYWFGQFDFSGRKCRWNK